MLNCPISQEELWKIVNIYKNQEDLKKSIDNRNTNQILSEEYYLIKDIWLENFKKIFHYDGIIGAAKSNKIILGELKVPPVIYNIPNVDINEKKIIQIIINKDITYKYKTDVDSFSYYYKNFCLISPKYYNIITEGYNIDEKIKTNFLISNGMFILDLTKNNYEVGIFETPYSYNALFVIKFEKNVNCNREIKKIFDFGLIGYLHQYNIMNDNLIMNHIIDTGNFTLTKIFLNEKWVDSIKKQKELKLSLENNTKISNIKCFKNFSPESSKLNSVVQVLISLNEIYTLFKKELFYFNKFNHIYILSSFFSEIIMEIDNEKKDQISLKPMNFIINYLNNNIPPNDLIDYLNVVLQILHNELIIFPGNLNFEKLESIESQLQDRNMSLQIFMNYYNGNINNGYKKSIISNMFNCIIEKKVNCNNMYNTSSFLSTPMIIFDFDLFFQNKNQNNNQELIFDIINLFMEYSKTNNKDIFNPCQYCNNMHFSNHYIYSTSAYLIVVLNNRKNFNNIKIKYSNKLDISTCVQNSNVTKYKLKAIIMEEGDQYYSVIKNEKKELENEYEEWKKYKDENVSRIIINNNNFDKNSNYEVYNEVNARILFYKGIN